MLSRIDDLTRRLHADPEDPMTRAQLRAERQRVFGEAHQQAGLLAPDAVLEFVLGGRAGFSLQSLKTNEHLTYHVTQKVEGRGEDKVKHELWYVDIMTGSDNESHYERLGLITADMSFKLVNEARFTATDPCALAFAFMWRLALAGEGHPNLRVWHHGRCGVCARKLSVPESVARGIGPECAAKATKGQRAELKEGSGGRRRFEERFLALKRERESAA